MIFRFMCWLPVMILVSGSSILYCLLWPWSIPRNWRDNWQWIVYGWDAVVLNKEEEDCRYWREVIGYD